MPAVGVDVNPPVPPNAIDPARRRAVRRTALFVGLMAVVVYAIFIATTVLSR